MNLGDKTRSVTIRLSQSLYDFLNASAKAANTTPSQFLRMMIAGVKSMQESAGFVLNNVSKEVEKNR